MHATRILGRRICWLLFLFAAAALQARNPASFLADAQRKLDDAASLQARFYALGDVAKLSFEAGDPERAAACAEELLRMAPEFRDDWNYGNALHDGEMVLGRVALARGRVDEAKRRLLAAARTPGSPQLGSFGPNLSLADDLLRIGERDVVVEYLQRSARFWKRGRGRLAIWTQQVRNGQRPAFGGNLLY